MECLGDAVCFQALRKGTRGVRNSTRGPLGAALAYAIAERRQLSKLVTSTLATTEEPTMPIPFQCGHCGHHNVAADNQAGTQMACQSCGAPQAVPGAAQQQGYGQQPGRATGSSQGRAMGRAMGSSRGSSQGRATGSSQGSSRRIAMGNSQASSRRIAMGNSPARAMGSSQGRAMGNNRGRLMGSNQGRAMGSKQRRKAIARWEKLRVRVASLFC